MRLRRLGSGKWGEVVAVEEASGKCPTLEGIRGTQGESAMLALLTVTVPKHGPQKDNSELCVPLKGPENKGLWEFRKQPRGAKTRAIFFEDGERLVVCVTAFTKTTETPPRELRRARELRAEYLEAKRLGQLVMEAGRN